MGARLNVSADAPLNDGLVSTSERENFLVSEEETNFSYVSAVTTETWPLGLGEGLVSLVMVTQNSVVCSEIEHTRFTVQIFESNVVFVGFKIGISRNQITNEFLKFQQNLYNIGKIESNVWTPRSIQL